MSLNDLLKIINCLVIAGIVLQLVFFFKEGKPSMKIGFVTWGFISLYASGPILIILGLINSEGKIQMSLNDLVQIINCIASAAIVLQLIFFSKEEKHSLKIGFVTWIFISLYASVPILTIFGEYTVHHPLEAAINASIASLIFYIRGSFSIFFRALKKTREITKGEHHE